jgi:phospholipid transport system substrate-binding protein
MIVNRSLAEQAMKIVGTTVVLLLSLSMAVLLAAVAHAQPAAPLAPISRDDPQKMLEQATNQLLDISRAARAYADTDRERYYEAVSPVLDQVMDIDYFAKGVMATYASARLYKSLQTDAERAAFRERLERFKTALKRVWMVKYADAVLSFKGERIDLAKLDTGDDSPGRRSMEQTVHDEDGKTYVIQYSLHKVKDGSWMISNVIVEHVNLGLTYRDQFAESVENHKGDVDYVVDHWIDIMLHAKSSDSAGESKTSQ